MKNGDFDARQAPDETPENKEDDDDLGRDSENFIDKNVVRKRLLEKLGEKLQMYDQTKNNDYFKNSFYDPLFEDMYDTIK